MENFGYILSEAPFLLLIIWTTISFVRWRRARDNRPLFSFSDKRILFHAAQYGPHHWQFYPRLVLASTAVAVLGSLQIVALAPLGAAILTASIILTSTTIVHGLMLQE